MRSEDQLIVKLSMVNLLLLRVVLWLCSRMSLFVGKTPSNIQEGWEIRATVSSEMEPSFRKINFLILYLQLFYKSVIVSKHKNITNFKKKKIFHSLKIYKIWNTKKTIKIILFTLITTTTFWCIALQSFIKYTSTHTYICTFKIKL